MDSIRIRKSMSIILLVIDRLDVQHKRLSDVEPDEKQTWNNLGTSLAKALAEIWIK